MQSSYHSWAKVCSRKYLSAGSSARRVANIRQKLLVGKWSISRVIWPGRCRFHAGGLGDRAHPTPCLAPNVRPRTRLICRRGHNLSSKKPQTEHRRWERLPLAVPVFVRSKDGNDKELLEFATALNVSAGGALVAVRRSLPLSARVLLEIPSAPVASAASLPQASRSLQARIVWVTHADGYQLVGVKFSHALLGTNSHRPPKRRKAVSPV